MKPEKIDGKIICKPYTRGGDGIMTRLESTSVMFPPSISIKPNVMSYEEMAGKMTDHIVSLKAMKKTELAQLLYNFTQAVAQNERARITGNG